MSSVEVLKDLGMGAFEYRTEGEDKYMERVTALDPLLVASWVGRSNVDDKAIYFAKPQLCVYFRYLEKADLHYWTKLIRNKRLARAVTGYAVSSQSVMQNNASSAKRVMAYAKLTVGRSRVEVLIACYAELAQIFNYKASALMDPQSGSWLVAYTIFVAKSVAFFLFDRYEKFRLWSLLRRMIEFMRELVFKPVLGSDQNVEEFEYILNLTSGTYFRWLPQH